MKRIHLVPFTLSLSVLSLVMFLFASIGLNKVHSDYEEEKSENKELERIVSNQAEHIDSLNVIKKAIHDEQVRWLARAIVSETDRQIEMYHVGWVIRNRVEVGFRGENSYKGVVLDPYQFSAFNPERNTRYHYSNLSVEDISNKKYGDQWYNALKIAKRVKESNSLKRPFSKKTLYFYSEVSMPEIKPHPHWKDELKYVEVKMVEPKRFRFFADNDYEPQKITGSSTITAR